MTESTTSIVFMGSPEFAVPVLQALYKCYQVIGVVTQPDRPSGRGRSLKSPPVKELALQLGLPVIQPRKLREPEAMDKLRVWAPRLIVVAAFGQILRKEVLDLPPAGCINVHASLLPRWRGAAPIQAAILHGDPETGVTIMRMDAGIDTGAILSQSSIPVGESDTAEELSRRLAFLGAELLIETLPGYLNGGISPKPQDEAGVTYAPMLKKEDGRLEYDQPAQDLERRVRAFHPWPGAFIEWQGQTLKVLRASVAQEAAMETGKTPGERTIHEGKPAVFTSQCLLVLDEVQPAGKRPMPGHDFLRGARGWA